MLKSVSPTIIQRRHRRRQTSAVRSPHVYRWIVAILPSQVTRPLFKLLHQLHRRIFAGIHGVCSTVPPIWTPSKSIWERKRTSKRGQ